MFDLSNHVALVTGGNGGLGLAMAKGLAKAGAKIAIWGRDEDKNVTALSELQAMGADAESFICDVTDAEQCNKNFQATLERFGKVDSCFANAGGSGPMGMLHQLDQEAWQSVLDLNVNSVVNSFQPAISHMLDRQQGGKLIVMSSVAALVGTPMSAGYATTKAAVVGLIRSLAVELGRAGIQANAILPGYIETEMSVQTPQAFKDACERRSASGQHGSLEDMEGVAVFLASSESRFMTGQCLVLDGGHSIHPM